MSWFRVTVIGRIEGTETPVHAISGGSSYATCLRRAMRRVEYAMMQEGIYLDRTGGVILERLADLSVMVQRWSCYEDFSLSGVDDRRLLLATRLQKLGGPSSGPCSPSDPTERDWLEPPASSN